MSTLHLRRRARELWDTPHNQRAWIRSVLVLGNKWLLAEKQQKIVSKQ
jgi:hypothetical protein